jgi:hypothetical protein
MTSKEDTNAPIFRSELFFDISNMTSRWHQRKTQT